MSENLACRLLPHLIADGPTQMALDHALLDSVDRNPTSAVLRTYEWSEPTLSLGYFQTIAEAESNPRWSGVPIVRRMSGGGALFHHFELTYALIMPRTHPLAIRPSALYRAVHAALAARMRQLGIAARRRGEVARRSAERPFLCFLDDDSEDLLMGDAKVVGSAQRRRPFAVLQHGSLLFARSPWTSELPGLRDLDFPDAGIADWSREVPQVLGEALGLKPRLDVMSPEECRDAQRLKSELYTARGWTARR